MRSDVDSMNYSAKVIPQLLRLCNTFFTQMVIVEKYNKTNIVIPPHLDEDHVISCIIT